MVRRGRGFRLSLSTKTGTFFNIVPGLQINCPAADRFTRLLGRYLEVNTRNAGQLVAKQAKDVSLQLYKATAALAPSEAAIARKVKSLGWRVKRKPGAWPLKKGEKCGSKGPLRRMQAAQIKKRAKARGTVATGWLPAVTKFGGSAGKRLVQIRNPKGSVTISGMGTSSPSITITNSTPGIAAMEKQHHLLSTAFNEASKDIVTYLRRKQQENANKVQR